MNAEDVLQIYNQLASKGVPIWIDGGWCVDALLGKQTREHPDLDIAIDHNNESQLKEFLIDSGYKIQARSNATDWNYVMINNLGKTIDIHVFEFDEAGDNKYGIEYHKDSLTGMGDILGEEVQCISPEWMFKFKTAYMPKGKDLQDVHALSEKYGFEVPATHQ